MLKGVGQIRIDGVAVGEASINLLSPTPHLAIKYAFINTVTDERFGSGNRNANWSEETLTKLGEFIQAVERDVALEMFTGGAPAVEESPPTTDGVGEDALPHTADEDGIPSF